MFVIFFKKGKGKCRDIKGYRSQRLLNHLLSHSKNILCYNMDELQKHCAKEGENKAHVLCNPEGAYPWRQQVAQLLSGAGRETS